MNTFRKLKSFARWGLHSRRPLLVATLCLRLSGAPLPLAHAHSELSGLALARHLALHHSSAAAPEPWHWHLVTLDESDGPAFVERPKLDLTEFEVLSDFGWADLAAPLGTTVAVVHLRGLTVAGDARCAGFSGSFGDPPSWRDHICVRTL